MAAFVGRLRSWWGCLAGSCSCVSSARAVWCFWWVRWYCRSLGLGIECFSISWSFFERKWAKRGEKFTKKCKILKVKKLNFFGFFYFFGVGEGYSAPFDSFFSLTASWGYVLGADLSASVWGFGEQRGCWLHTSRCVQCSSGGCK